MARFRLRRLRCGRGGTVSLQYLVGPPPVWPGKGDPSWRWASPIVLGLALVKFCGFAETTVEASTGIRNDRR